MLGATRIGSFVVLALFVASCDTSSTAFHEYDDTTVATATTVAATATTTTLDHLAAACVVVNDRFEPLIAMQLKATDNFGKALRRALGGVDQDFQGVFDASDALVLDSAKLVNEGNPHGDALLAYAISSRRIAAEVMEHLIREAAIPGTGFPVAPMDPAVLDDRDEFQAFEVVRARCEALGQ